MTQPNSAANSTAKKSNVAKNMADRAIRAVNNADERAARDRVIELRMQRADTSNDDLVELLVKQKCVRTGVVGAVTSSASLIPELGTLATMTLGVAADIGLTLKMQAELVLEIAAIYAYEFSAGEKQQALLLVTGISVGADQMLNQAGKQLSQKAVTRLEGKASAKAIPVVGVVASAGANAFATYIIGQRAKAYFSLGPDAVGDWSESVRAITGVDERKLTGWASAAGAQMRRSIATGVKSQTQRIRKTLTVGGSRVRDRLRRPSAAQKNGLLPEQDIPIIIEDVSVRLGDASNNPGRHDAQLEGERGL